MRIPVKEVVLAACLFGPGCQFACTVARNIVHEPLLACDEKATHHRCRKLGKQAWNEMVRQYGEAFSCDYREGFVDGFEDYLYYGGCNGGPAGSGCGSGQCGANAATNTATNSSPSTDTSGAGENIEYPVCPPVPPERYRRKKYMTPEGCAAVEDWFAGFRHGAATAMQSGLRNLVVIPVQCPPVFGPDDGGPLPKATRPAPVASKGTTPPMPPPDEITPPSSDILPSPRPNVEANPMPTTPPPPGG